MLFLFLCLASSRFIFFPFLLQDSSREAFEEFAKTRTLDYKAFLGLCYELGHIVREQRAFDALLPKGEKLLSLAKFSPWWQQHVEPLLARAYESLERTQAFRQAIYFFKVQYEATFLCSCIQPYDIAYSFWTSLARAAYLRSSLSAYTRTWSISASNTCRPHPKTHSSSCRVSPLPKRASGSECLRCVALHFSSCWPLQ